MLKGKKWLPYPNDMLIIILSWLKYYAYISKRLLSNKDPLYNFLNFRVNHPATKLPSPPITITMAMALTPPLPVDLPSVNSLLFPGSSIANTILETNVIINCGNVTNTFIIPNISPATSFVGAGSSRCTGKGRGNISEFRCPSRSTRSSEGRDGSSLNTSKSSEWAPDKTLS